MKKGINVWSFAAGTSVEKSIKIAKYAGFDGIELALNNYDTAEIIPSYKHYGNQIVYNTSKTMDAILGRSKSNIGECHI